MRITLIFSLFLIAASYSALATECEVLFENLMKDHGLMVPERPRLSELFISRKADPKHPEYEGDTYLQPVYGREDQYVVDGVKQIFVWFRPTYTNGYPQKSFYPQLPYPQEADPDRKVRSTDVFQIVVGSNFVIPINTTTFTTEVSKTKSLDREGSIDESQGEFLEAEEKPTAEKLRFLGYDIVSLSEKPGQRNPEGVIRIPRIQTQLGEVKRVRDHLDNPDVARLISPFFAKRKDKLDGFDEVPIEFKRPVGNDGIVTVETVINAIKRSLKRGGQATYLVIDLHHTDLTAQDSLNIYVRIIGVLQRNWHRGYGDLLKEVRIWGRDFDHQFVFRNVEHLLVSRPPWKHVWKVDWGQTKR